MNTLFDDMYMKKHLGEYILFQIDQGYDINDIRNALSRFGYKKDLVKQILQQLNITSTKKKSAMYSVHDLDEELRVYVQSLLIDYIVKEHKVGYPLEAIKKALINYGHDQNVIDEAILIIEKGNVVDYRAVSNPVQFPQQIIAPITVFFMFTFLVFLSIATDTSIIIIIPNFLPAIIAFALVNVAYFFLPKTKLLAALPLLGVLITVGSFIVGIQYGFLGAVPGSDIVLILNAAVGLVSTAIVCAFSKKEKDEIIVHIKDKRQRKQAEEEHALVEDKIGVSQLAAQIPKEPYHLKGYPVIPHQSKPAQPLQHDQLQKNSMLHYLKKGIDRKPEQHVVASAHPVVSKQPVLMKHQAQRLHGKPSSSHRLSPKSVEPFPEKREKERKIALKEME